MKPSTVFMPIMLDSQLRQYDSHPRSLITSAVFFNLSMTYFEPHEAQAVKNHEQSLRRLAERGGLSPCEACAILEDRPWKSMTHQEGYRYLHFLIEKARMKPFWRRMVDAPKDRIILGCQGEGQDYRIFSMCWRDGHGWEDPEMDGGYNPIAWAHMAEPPPFGIGISYRPR